MASRRAPLANVPGAINSPFRNVPSISGKRTRAQAGEQKDNVYGQPPSKKQAVEAVNDDEENIDPRRKNGVTVTVLDKLDEPFSKQRPSHPPTAFEKKLASVREKKPTPSRAGHPHKQHADNLESVRQWQKHYRRQFPQFVFYFDNVQEDVRTKHVRQIQSLGAREERFFSKAVTHVITTRQIPPELVNTSPEEEVVYEDGPAKTMQPVAHDQKRTTSLLDAHLQRRTQQASAPTQFAVESRRGQTQNVDILTRARALGIKIWAQEKLGRVLSTILETDTGDHSQTTRSHVTTRGTTRQTQDVDLEQLLRHEKVKGPADRDMTVAAHNMTTLRGCYLYVHDMDERTKPVLVRDYEKPASKQDGKWPQFRLSGPGRCPFVEDVAHTKKLQQQERDAQARLQQDIFFYRRTRAGSALPSAPSQALAEREMNLRRSPRKLAQVTKPNQAKPLDPPPVAASRRQSSAEMPPLFGSTQANFRTLPRMVGGEPVASGIQPSNVTSAIRSQAISSAAISSTAPGLNRRMGDTKEVSLLKRKVLSNNSMPSSHVNDIRAAINDPQDPPPRAAKRKAQETLGVLHEDVEAVALGQRPRAKASGPKRAKVVQKEAKPGYCENCRDKFDDFDEHIASRKHRKFAVSPENWKELDNLLAVLKRPHKKAP
ncbi:related to DBF4-regulatory subunit for Cdc7p kinase [Lecanosticta acicola]|uniref:Related to DBF4-regulatory subunit for Cdc7p kinase n=1 Tax=Lecanosticta acicola TaxID=111012 RepID=A0AAI9ECN1_9PEZI|nr:related to DBF4-regulatory subunit for Cdc7p kinase [Lecanosticta acicola]